MIAIWLVLATFFGIGIGWVLGSKGALSDRIVISPPASPKEEKGPSLDTLMAEIAGLKAQVIAGPTATEQIKSDQTGTYQAEISALKGRVQELQSQPQEDEEEPEPDIETNLLELPDLTPKDQAKLINKAGVQSMAQLFEQAKSRDARTNLATKTGIDPHKLLWWANILDFQQLRGQTINLAHYLSAAGATSLPELARKRPHLLLPQLKQVMEQNGSQEDCPTEQTLTTWIEEAKTLPRRVQ